MKNNMFLNLFKIIIIFFININLFGCKCNKNKNNNIKYDDIYDFFNSSISGVIKYDNKSNKWFLNHKEGNKTIKNEDNNLEYEYLFDKEGNFFQLKIDKITFPENIKKILDNDYENKKTAIYCYLKGKFKKENIKITNDNTAITYKDYKYENLGDSKKGFDELIKNGADLIELNLLKVTKNYYFLFLSFYKIDENNKKIINL